MANEIVPDMPHERLGRNGLVVSRICLGTMTFGNRTEEAEARRICDHAHEAGVNFIDTADAYAAGLSEEIVGRAIAARREDWLLATKAGNPMGPGMLARGLGRRWLTRACEDSLRRLGTDRIDLFYLHLEDYGTPLEETVATMGDLIAAGKIRHFGLSNFRAWRIVEICRICDATCVPRPIACQPCYNALNRGPEVEVLPASFHCGLGVVPYSPLARGVLTAKYTLGEEAPQGSRAGADDRRLMETEWRSESFAIARKIADHAAGRGFRAADFALSWLLANRRVTAVLAGPRTFDQWQDYLNGLAYPFDAEDEALMDRLVAPGHPSTPGYNDPRYPIEGRVPSPSSARMAAQDP